MHRTVSLCSPTSDPSPFRSSLGLMFSLFQRNAHVPFNLISPAGWWASWWSSFEKVILVSLEWESMWWHADYMSEPFQAPFGYFITDGGRKIKPLPDFLIPYLVHEAYAEDYS